MIETKTATLVALTDAEIAALLWLLVNKPTMLDEAERSAMDKLQQAAKGEE